MDNPCKWLSAVAWDNVTELDKYATNSLKLMGTILLV